MLLYFTALHCSELHYCVLVQSNLYYEQDIKYIVLPIFGVRINVSVFTYSTSQFFENQNLQP